MEIVISIYQKMHVKLQQTQVVITSLICLQIVLLLKTNISTVILMICMPSTLPVLMMVTLGNTENFLIGARVICTPRDIMNSNRKRIMSCNCPTKDFTAFHTINPVGAYTRRLIVQQMARYVM